MTESALALPHTSRCPESRHRQPSTTTTAVRYRSGWLVIVTACTACRGATYRFTPPGPARPAP